MKNKRGEHTQMIKRMGYLIILCFLIVILALQSVANQLNVYQDQLNQKSSRISNITKQISSTKADLNWNKQKRDNLVKDLEEMGLKKEEVDQQIQLLESALMSLDEAIAKAEAEYAYQENLLKDRLWVMYKRSNMVWELEELFKSQSLNELFVRTKLMKQIKDYDQKLLDNVEAKRLEIEELKEQKLVEIENCREQANIYSVKIQDLHVSRSTLDKEIQGNQQSLSQYEKDQAVLLKESDQLEDLIKNLKSIGTQYIGGDMTWPMPTNKHIGSPYGNRLHPIHKVWKMHTGIDIGSAMNEYIVAAADGVVNFAGPRNGYGNTVILDHGGGITTLYAHINNRGIMVSVGQEVKAGQTIAKAGTTGLSTGPHLHFEVRKNGATQDPLKYVKP